MFVANIVKKVMYSIHVARIFKKLFIVQVASLNRSAVNLGMSALKTWWYIKYLRKVTSQRLHNFWLTVTRADRRGWSHINLVFMIDILHNPFVELCTPDKLVGCTT